LTGRENEVVSRATDPFQRALRTRSRTRFVEKSADNTETNSVTPSSSSSSDFSRSRSRSRFRSSTTNDNSIVDSTTKLPTTTTPILFRRRSRPTSTTRPTTTSTTTTTTTTTTSTTTTPRPTTTTKKASANSSDKKDKNSSDEEDADYYYYYYDEDEETPSNGNSKDGATYDDLLDKSQTQRTTGLRTQDFATASSGAQIEKGFTKRNLHTRHGTSSSVVDINGNSGTSPNSRVATASTKKPKVERNNRTSFTRSIDSSNYRSRRPQNNSTTSLANNNNPFDKIIAGESGNEKSRDEDTKWSERAVVPLSEKIRLRPDGSVQCLDHGLFHHPVNCRQFVHCAENTDGTIQSWLFACPKSLAFDGQMCNWTADNACIE